MDLSEYIIIKENEKYVVKNPGTIWSLSLAGSKELSSFDNREHLGVLYC